MPGIYNELLKCNIENLHYDFNTKTCDLFLTEGNFVNMSGAIGLVTRIDPDVQCIRTHICLASSSIPDTFYQKVEGVWEAFLAQKPIQNVWHKPTIVIKAPGSST